MKEIAGKCVSKTLADDYLKDRVFPRMNYYDRRARRYKLLSRGMRIVTSILSISILFVVHIEPLPKLIVTLASAIIVLLVSLESIGQFEGLWRSYRMTNDAIETEIYLHHNSANPYDRARADTLFVERVERILSAEAQNWSSLVSNIKMPAA